MIISRIIMTFLLSLLFNYVSEDQFTSFCIKYLLGVFSKLVQLLHLKRVSESLGLTIMESTRAIPLNSFSLLYLIPKYTVRHSKLKVLSPLQPFHATFLAPLPDQSCVRLNPFRIYPPPCWNLLWLSFLIIITGWASLRKL